MRAEIGRGLLVIAALGVASAASAAEEKKKDGRDPNRIICEKQEELGSRLGSKRVCMTAAEWQAKRQEQRQMIDRSQTLRNTPSGG